MILRGGWGGGHVVLHTLLWLNLDASAAFYQTCFSVNFNKGPFRIESREVLFMPYIFNFFLGIQLLFFDILFSGYLHLRVRGLID